MHAKPQCDWVIAFDVDEYITPTDALLVDDQSLESKLAAHSRMKSRFSIKDIIFGTDNENLPVYRLPWYVEFAWWKLREAIQVIYFILSGTS